VPDEAHLVIEGLVRAYYPTAIEDITVNFVAEGEFATHYTSLESPRLSHFSFEALEDTIVVAFSYEYLGKLRTVHAELERQSGYMKSQQAAIRDKLFSIMGQSNQNALMLYSQKPEYVFDMAYACHEATEQYDDFKKNVQPFRLLIEKNKAEIARYDYLINSLSTMNVSTLSKKAQTDKSVCLTFAVNIRHTLNDNSNQFKDYINYYQEIEQQLKALNDYANKRYKNIQSGIFNNAG